jgi:selenocysteine lyase/cysteine desulfurase
LLLKLGSAEVERHLLGYTDLLVARLQSRGCQIVSSLAPAERSAIVAWGLPNVSSEAVVQRLSEAKVVCALRDDAVRVSPHVYNNEEDVERLLAAL